VEDREKGERRCKREWRWGAGRGVTKGEGGKIGLGGKVVNLPP